MDYDYKRKGTCNAFCRVEPKVNRYCVNITDQRKSEDFADPLKEITEHYPDVQKIDLDMDNLNTQ